MHFAERPLDRIQVLLSAPVLSRFAEVTRRHKVAKTGFEQELTEVTESGPSVASLISCSTRSH